MNRRDRRTRPEPQRRPLRKVKEERWSDKGGRGRWECSVLEPEVGMRGRLKRRWKPASCCRGRGMGTEGRGYQALPSAERPGEGGHLKVIISQGGGSGRLIFCFVR